MTKQLPKQILYLLSSWLLAVTLEYLLLPAAAQPLTGLTGLAQMSGLRIICVTASLMVLWNFLPEAATSHPAFRFVPAFAFSLYATAAVIHSFTWAFFFVCALVLALLVVYALKGWNCNPAEPVRTHKEHILWPILTGVLALMFFAIVSIWTVARIHSFSTPTFDFGIFAQMFHNMKETGLPITTVERDGPLSHFDVHVSPIYYLMLPFYCLVPRPETLQVLQAAVLASAVIPLWKLGKHHGLHPALRTMVCALLLLYPAYAGGTSYDIHENCFLTPLILWLLYALDRKNIPLTALFATLTMMVKEDAPVYVAIIALYLLLRSALRREKWGLFAGISLLFGALAWFFAVTSYLASQGDGVMNYRYSNFMYDGSNSLLTVIKAVLLCPIKAVFECVDEEKLKFIGYTMLPLLGLPLLTRRYERLLLLIPYVLVNLMSDYQYQHDILFQYTFGSTACLMYLVVVNLSDLKLSLHRLAATGLALCIGFSCFTQTILPLAKQYVTYCDTYADYYDQQRAILTVIPEDASVAATTFYTTYLSSRSTLYDIRYCSQEHVLECEYVVIKVSETGSFKSYDGKENFVALLLENGYVLEAEIPGTTEIYRKA